MKTRWIAALAALAIVVAGCSSSGGSGGDDTDGTGGELQGSHWVLDSYAVDGAQVIVPDGLYADAEFTANRVKGFAGCNDFDAVYRSAGRLLLVSMPILTRAFCSEEINAFESTYVGLLQQSRFYSVRADTLVVRGPDRAVLLVFDAAPDNPLLGSWVVDSYKTADGAVSVPIAGTELTVVFRLIKAAGSSGCNTFQGPYTTNGKVAAIGPLATTQIACAEDVMAQESAFLAALQGVARIESRGTTLSLQDRDGGILVALIRPSAIEPEASPSPSAAPSASASAKPSASASVKPSAAPSPSVKPTASPPPTPAPTPSGSVPPTIAPPVSLPPTATCVLTASTVPGWTATFVYPADWFTIADPRALACRYFDPATITVPVDPATLTTAVMIKADPTIAYDDALAAATNPTAWNVLVNEPVTTPGGLPTTRLEATSTAGSPGVPAGMTRYGYLMNVGGFPVWIETIGTLDDATYTANVSVVDLIASQSTFVLGTP